MKRENAIKLFFLDLDGTLLDKKTPNGKAISEKNLKAIKKARAQNMDICISTGRIGTKVIEYLQMSGLDYAVSGNGSQIIDKKGNVLKEIFISEKSMKFIEKFIRENELSIKIDNTRIAYNVVSSEGVFMANKLGYGISEDSNFAFDEKAIKLIVWGKNPSVLPKFVDLMTKFVPGVSVVSAERGWTLEVTNELATKATGNIWAMKNIFNIDDINLCCHIGDTMNDFPVVNNIGYFISPSDAQSDLLNKAPYITVPHYKGAVAEVLEGNFWENPLINK